MSILAFCLVSRVLFYSSPEDRVGNEQGRILGTKLACIEFHSFYSASHVVLLLETPKRIKTNNTGR